MLVENNRKVWGGVSSALCPCGRAWLWFWVLTCWHLRGSMGLLGEAQVALIQGRVSFSGAGWGEQAGCRPKLEADRPSWKNAPMAWFPPHDPRPHAFRWIWGRGAIAWTSGPSWPEICGVGTFLSGCSLWKRKERKCPNPKPIIGSFKSPASGAECWDEFKRLLEMRRGEGRGKPRCFSTALHL